MRQHRTVVLQASCGFGKTHVLSAAVAGAYERGKTVIFGVHRKELIAQTAATFDKFGFPYSYIASNRKTTRASIYIASIPTLRNRLGEYPADFLLIDEAHLSMAEGWQKVINHYRDAGSYILGCTASPQRLDGKGLRSNFGYMVQAPPMRESIDDGSLCGYRLFAPNTPDKSGLHVLAGDYRKDESDALMNKPSITGDAISHWEKHASGLRSVYYCTSIKHSKAVAAAFRDRGIPRSTRHPM